MNIQNVNTVSFQGGFRFRALSPVARESMDKIVNNGKQIFDNFEREGDTFLVIRDKYDKRVANYIKDNQLDYFEYYPSINTGCGLDNEIPETLINALKGAESVKMSADDIINAGNKSAKSVKKDPNLINILKNAGIFIVNPSIKNKSDIKIITDKSKNLEVMFSPLTKDNCYYVRAESLRSESSHYCKRYKLSADGEIIREYEDIFGIMEFGKLFKDACLNK